VISSTFQGGHRIARARRMRPTSSTPKPSAFWKAGFSDCVIMAGIAARIVSELKITEGGTDEVHFTVFQTFQMLKKLQADYDAVYTTDKPMPL
jgi:hypothetical protein